MLYDANLEALKRCVRNNEAATYFDLGVFVHPCGTFGCLVGNDAIACGQVGDDRFMFSIRAWTWAQEEYGLCDNIVHFLFGLCDSASVYGRGLCVGEFFERGCNKSLTDREAALNRMRKTIAYIERKRAIWYEADGRISERARRQSGNWNVCASVLSSIAVSA